jgi:cytochrome c biogenesis protein CcmG/thiol:disulfide interchange protein DsbE
MRLVRWAALAVAAGALVLGVVLGSRFGTDPNLIVSPLIGEPVPEMELPYLDREETLSFEDLRGEIVVVNFWASWCSACRAEHPDLIATATAYRESGVRFVGIVYQDTPGSAKAMLDELGWGYDYVLDPGSRAAIEFGVFGVPETFFIDGEGSIVAKITGQSNALLLSSTLDRMLRGESPESKTVGTVQPAPDR